MALGDETQDLRRQRDSLLELAEGLRQRIRDLRDLLERIYRSPGDAETLIRAELDGWEEP